MFLVHPLQIHTSANLQNSRAKAKYLLTKQSGTLRRRNPGRYKGKASYKSRRQTEGKKNYIRETGNLELHHQKQKGYVDMFAFSDESNYFRELEKKAEKEARKSTSPPSQ